MVSSWQDFFFCRESNCAWQRVSERITEYRLDRCEMMPVDSISVVKRALRLNQQQGRRTFRRFSLFQNTLNWVVTRLNAIRILRSNCKVRFYLFKSSATNLWWARCLLGHIVETEILQNHLYHFQLSSAAIQNTLRLVFESPRGAVWRTITVEVRQLALCWSLKNGRLGLNGGITVVRIRTGPKSSESVCFFCLLWQSNCLSDIQ